MGYMQEFIQNKLSFALTEPTPFHISTGYTVAELVDDYAGEVKLVWGLSEISSPTGGEGFRFVHKRLWRETGQWEKGQPKTLWYKKPIPVRFSTKLSPLSEQKLLHTFKDSDGTVIYVYETTNNCAEWWVLYV